MRCKSLLAAAALAAAGSAAAKDIASFADAGRFAFVPSRDAPEVAVLDGSSDRVVARIALGGVPRQVLVSEAAGVLVASFAGANALEIVELAAPASRAKLDVALAPEAMVLSPDGYLVALADRASGAVAIVSLAKRQVLARLSGFADPRSLTFSLDGSQLYLTQGRTLEVIDIVQQQAIARLSLDATGGALSALTRTPDGRYGFVSLTGADAVMVIDLGTLQPVKRLRVGRMPLRPYGTADGRLMLVPNDGDASVSIIDTSTLTVAATLPGAKGVTAISTGWFESAAFVMGRDRRVVVLDLMKFQRLADIELPARPGPGVVTANGQKLYAPLADAGRVAIIDTQKRRLSTLVEGAGREPAAVVLARSNNYCH
jgi:YVTN family beta-propeller protein